MASSEAEAGTWLQQALLRLCSDPRSGIQLDPDVVDSLVSYCQHAPPSDATEYLSNMVGDENCKDIVTEYLKRRGVAGFAENGDAVQDGLMQVYVKPQMDESWSSGNKKNTKTSKSRNLDGKINSTAVIDSSNGHGSPGPGLKGKSGVNKGKRGGKGISLAEAAEGRMLISRGAPCTCQASRHKLVNNCLSCGKIVCEQEGEGPCNYCGALVLREGSTYAGLDGVTLPVSESEAAAQAFKDRLVQFGCTSSQRTTVIDDQSDYFQIDGNAWLSEEEKKSLQRQQQEIELAEEARKKKVVVTIDLLGRKVVMADDSDGDISMKTSILGGNTLEQRFNEVRIRPNPFVSDKPIFLDVVQSKDKESGKFNNRRRGDMHHDERFARSGRVQHDDVFVSSLDSITFKEAHDSHNDELWQNLKLKESIDQPFEDEECLMDCKVLESAQSSGVFDICEPQTDVTKREKLILLSPSTLIQKQVERKQVVENGSKAFNVLKPGMILLKHWLSQSDQVGIVKKCRDLGVGPGGFYQPSYGPDSKMHLQMMGLGMHWEPSTRSYLPSRTNDNARPPEIPPLFLMLVKSCLGAARHSLQEESRSKNSKGNLDVVLDMQPDICLVNFYERSGRLGLHQDRDESQESLQKRIPVVSFSIGDSAEFLYGENRDAEMAESITLESGDVLIFGGASRMIFHGVSRIHPLTAPSWLIEETNVRPGRINLTFRQL